MFNVQAASGSDTEKPRSVASDFFENQTKPKANEDLEEKDEVGSNFDCVSITDDASSVGDVDFDPEASTIVLNWNLFQYFSQAFSGSKDLKFKKLQLLVLQFVLEFNQKFWANCLGLQFLPKVADKYWPEE